MAYKFRADEQVPRAVIRCAGEQLDHAVFELSNGIKTDPVRAIHSARKAIKKERSLLRLVRSSLPRDERRRENAMLRDAARGLSGTRDADVMIASIDDLSQRFAGQLPAATFRTIREHLQARAQHGNGAGSAVDQGVIRELAAVRSRVDDWQLRDGGWNALESGLVRSYSRGRKALQCASGGEMEALHAWRKRVKDLWYHDRLLAPTCGPMVRGHAKDLDRLAKLLGDDHDLAVLGQELTRPETSIAADLGAVVQLIDYLRAELQTEATSIGERVYAESPKAFRRRMRRSWKAGRKLGRAQQEQHPAELAAATR